MGKIFFYKTLIRIYQISKSRGSWPTCTPLATPMVDSVVYD